MKVLCTGSISSEAKNSSSVTIPSPSSGKNILLIVYCHCCYQDDEGVYKMQERTIPMYKSGSFYFNWIRTDDFGTANGSISFSGTTLTARSSNSYSGCPSQYYIALEVD